MRHAKSDPPPSPRFLDLARMGARDLEALLQRGEAPDAGDLAGWEHRGANTMAWAGLARIRKFMKGFYEEAGELFGYNCPIRQNRLDEPWIARPRHERPRRFGFYRALPVDPTATDNAYLHALLLDYGRGPNRALDPVRGIRDYLVRVEGEPAIYLGKAYYALGRLRVPVGFFVLERLRRAAPAG